MPENSKRNISKESLTLRKQHLQRDRQMLMEMVSAFEGVEFEHCQHIINTYNEIEDIIDAAIVTSESIGSGV